MPIDVFVVDPPWPLQKIVKKVRPNQIAELDYKTMDVADIFKLLDKEIFSQAAKDHAVFLWTVEKWLRSAEMEMNYRDYKLHCRFIWDKENGTPAAWTVKYSHEYLLWFYKEKMIPIDKDTRGCYKTVFREKPTIHSAKPDYPYMMIRDMYSMQAKMDVFARMPRKDYITWGNEKDKFKKRG